ncbi:MAG: hypothetical protein OdinLCB4_003660 [Candidatus Odinarchaeum yellowstonii]|uniref:Uncharacterized protein n=1 Tax=Odinarchaeota yellowstonii (strain LCB_4) TaxID=1841599 RepID=A0AAF0D3I8_ODILC|nr:MAG: hypothetical protein OdinLCB4_003660 [Candidatus Odinarchaeum yellowstonii]
MAYSLLNIEAIANKIKEVISKPVDEQSFLTSLWRVRAEVEYATSILSLELEGNTELERIAKPIKLKNIDKNSILEQINEVLLNLTGVKEDKIILFEKLWRLKELLTILLKVSDKTYKRIKIGEGNFNN